MASYCIVLDDHGQGISYHFNIISMLLSYDQVIPLTSLTFTYLASTSISMGLNPTNSNSRKNTEVVSEHEPLMLKHM